MSREHPELEAETFPHAAGPLEPEALQAEEGRKGGMVMTAASPTFVAPPRSIAIAEAPAAARAERLANWGAALVAGVAAGGILLAAELLLEQALHGHGLRAPVRVMASVVVGEQALVPPLNFDAGMTTAGLLIHFLVCVAFALALAPILRWFERGPAALVGAAYGLLTYNLVFYAAAMVQPTLIYGRGMPSILSHVLFGVTLAVLYRTFAGPPEAPIPEPPMEQIWRSETAGSG